MNHSPRITAHVLDGGRRAQIRIPAGADPQAVTVATLRAAAAGANISVDADAEARLAEIAERYRATGAAVAEVFAHGVDPVDGVDGAWRWAEGLGPGDDGETPDEACLPSRVVRIASGALVAHYVPPGPGRDGRAVTGLAIPARHGRAATVTPGHGLEARADGGVFATGDGALSVFGGVAAVRPLIEIGGAVDAATGGVEFDGDVRIELGVRDGLRVVASGGVLIGGPVEGAEIICAGGLRCVRGVASTRRARLIVGESASVGYLRNVDGVFRAGLSCKGEIEHSAIVVGAEFRCETGRVQGGSLELTGAAHVGSLGCPDWTPTLVSVGDLPLVAMEIRRLEAACAPHRAAIEAKDAEAAMLRAGGGRSPAVLERLTELQFERSELARQAEVIEKECAALRETTRLCRGAELRVEKLVHPRTRLRHAGKSFEFERELRGPLVIHVDERGEFGVTVAGHPTCHISRFAAEVTRAGEAPAPPPARRAA